MATDPRLQDVTVIVPAFNEATTVGAVVRRLRGAGVRVLVVDDGSTDGTAGAARAEGAAVARHRVNRGQGAAIQTGLELALARGAEILVTFDADGQHEVEDLPRLIEPIRAGRAEIVLGSRFLPGAAPVPPGRRWLLRGAVLFTRLTSRLPLTDAHNGLRAFSRRAAGSIRIQLDRMAHASELIDQIRRSRLPWLEVPVRVRYTEHSRAKGQGPLAAVRVMFDFLTDKVLP